MSIFLNFAEQQITEPLVLIFFPVGIETVDESVAFRVDRAPALFTREVFNKSYGFLLVFEVEKFDTKPFLKLLLREYG